jgi:pyruvate/2-oxoglutarate dehydrogenase complex dihydrolipoamide dehydrogenase (E3) component
VDYDVVVIGGGAAGLAAASAAARAEVRVLLVAEGEIGGDCTFTGCVPSKTLIDAAAHGVAFADAMARVRATVARIAATETVEVLRGQGIDVLRGRARFTGPHAIDVEGRSLRCSRIVIATGASPAVPAIGGLADTPYLTTESVFDLTDPPESLAILGGGAVGCELAQAFARLGVTVSLVEAAERLLPGVDPDASALLDKVFAGDGIAVHLGAQVISVRGEGERVVLRTSTGSTLSVRQLLVAVGRRPATTDLGLDAAGVRINERGFVVVDRHMATSADGVYAAGDVTGLFPHTHAAYAMGRVAVGAALHRVRRPAFDTGAIPRVVFTDPEVATVGAAEHEVTDPRARVAFLPLSEVDRAITADHTSGFVKLLAGPRSVLGNLGGGRVLGATIVADRAGELIHEPALAMHTGMFTGRLAQAAHAYPTWSIAVQQAAAQFFGGYGGRTARPARLEPEK